MFFDAAPVCVVSDEAPSAARTVEVMTRADDDEAEADMLEALERDIDIELAVLEGEATVVDRTGVDEADDMETDELGRADEVELPLLVDEPLTAVSSQRAEGVVCGAPAQTEAAKEAKLGESVLNWGDGRTFGCPDRCSFGGRRRARPSGTWC